MMNKAVIIFSFLCIACNTNESKQENDPGTGNVIETGDSKDSIHNQESNIYANQRFRNVSVKRLEEHIFEITGQAQVFEATLSWVVEDGHYELEKGFTTTSAGAPEWGDFTFTVEVEKKRSNSTLHLIIFESSAKDGSRQYELPILLY